MRQKNSHKKTPYGLGTGLCFICKIFFMEHLHSYINMMRLKRQGYLANLNNAYWFSETPSAFAS